MHITFVKKILANGEPCAKCADVEARLHSGGYFEKIDAVLVADEREATSEGHALATRLGVDRAPFFVVRDADGAETVYTVFFKFLREVLEAPTSASSEASEILRDNPELDLL